MAVIRGNMNGANNNIGGFDEDEDLANLLPEAIFEFNHGNDVDLSNLNVGDMVTAAQLTVDTSPSFGDISGLTSSRNIEAQVRITFSCNLAYTITLNEEMDLLFKLYRQDENGKRTQLTSVPYVIALSGDLTDETEITTSQLKKTETFYTEYFDNVRGGGTFTYVMEVSLTFSSIDLATIQSGFISATGQIDIRRFG